MDDSLRRINMKGQLSIEFILILTVIILLIQVMILPMNETSESSVDEFTRIGYLEDGYNNIINSIDKLETMSEGKLTTNFYVPEDSNFYFKDGNIGYEVGIDFNATGEGIAGCKDFKCSKFYINSFVSDNRVLKEGKHIINTTKQNGDINIQVIR